MLENPDSIRKNRSSEIIVEFNALCFYQLISELSSEKQVIVRESRTSFLKGFAEVKKMLFSTD